jgi:hypothetical protein
LSTLPADIARLLARELTSFRVEVELFPDDASLWRTLPGVSNPAGTLALHAAGNLRHFIGAVLGGSGYRRDRDAEFATRDLSRAELAKQLAATAEEVASVLAKLDPAVVEQPYPLAIGGVTPRTGLFLLHLSAHLAFHLGQAGYLRRALTGDSRTSGAISAAALG